MSGGRRSEAQALWWEVGASELGTVAAYKCHNYYGIDKHLPVYA
jgi:hypothetical protein